MTRIKTYCNGLLTIVTLIILTNCNRHSDDLDIKDYVDHWEINRTFETYNNSSLDIDTIEDKYRVVSGFNQVLVVTQENKPIFKEGKELTDLYRIKSLLIELDTADRIVTAQIPSKSRLFRKLIAFSPEHGIKPLHNDEKITLKRKALTIWSINSAIEDFEFSAELDFLANQILTDKFNYFYPRERTVR